MKLAKGIPLDVLFLLLLVPAHTEIKGVSFLLVIPLFLYLALEMWHPLHGYTLLPEHFGKTRLAFLLRFFLLLVMITGAVVVPSLTTILARLTAESASDASVYASIHDGATQAEAALDFLSEGINPYAARYDETPLKYYGFSGIDLPTNPAFEHFVYLPGLLAASFPVHQLFDFLGILYDQRWIYLLVYVVLVLLLPLLVEPPMLKLALLAGVALNPLLTGPVIIGMNDVFVILPLVLAALALSRRRFWLWALLFGFACTLKQSAWFFAPFYAMMLFQLLPQLPPTQRLWLMAKHFLLAGIVGLVVIAPFALWSFSDFMTDVFAYPGGAVAVNYPIRGLTVGVLLVGAGVIQSPLAPFPFWVLQLVVGIPLMALLLRYQWRQKGMGALFICAGLFIFGIGLVSRFFQSNYVGFVVFFISLGYLLNLAGNEAEAKPRLAKA